MNRCVFNYEHMEKITLKYGKLSRYFSKLFLGVEYGPYKRHYTLIKSGEYYKKILRQVTLLMICCFGNKRQLLL